ncbi:MAG: SRPBCC family protein [Nonlabens sp.]|nr:SRPBCC family protein [Nonlabens sp.]
MKIVKYVLILLLVAILGVVGYFALQDGSYNVTETKVINAPQEIIFAQISDFKNWGNWNPWMEQKGVTSTMGAITEGPGGNYSFVDEYGSGKMTIKSVEPNNSIQYDMHYEHPMGSSDAVVSMDIVPVDNGNKVIWTLKGVHSLQDKIMNFFMGINMEKEVRPMYIEGLNNLEKYALESMKAYDIAIVGIEATGESYYLNIETTASMEKFAEAMAAQKERLLQYMNDNHLVMSGKPVVFYDKVDYEYNSIVFRVAVPVPVCPNQDPSNPEITCSYKPASDDVVVLLTGNYAHLTEALEKAERYVIDEKLEKSGLATYEIYMNDASNEDNPAMYKTEIHIPVKQVIVYE